MNKKALEEKWKWKGEEFAKDLTNTPTKKNEMTAWIGSLERSRSPKNAVIDIMTRCGEERTTATNDAMFADCEGDDNCALDVEYAFDTACAWKIIDIIKADR